MKFDVARKIADAVLYEGYALYPYRPSSGKNRFRWQFGVVAPRGYSESGGCEPWEMQTECLIEPQDSPIVHITVRFLHIHNRLNTPWEEGVEREAELGELAVADLLEAGVTTPVTMPGSRETRDNVEYERWPVEGVIRVSADQAGGLVRLRVRIENLTPWPVAYGTDRSAAIRRSFVGTHTLLGVRGGAFVSLMDPAPVSCSNLHTWPVLVGAEGDRNVMLSSPIILYDYPAVAPESPGDLFDGTEIDELLTLRVMTLTDEEKSEARGTDERVRRIVDRSDTIPREMFEKLHGAIRSLGRFSGQPLPGGRGSVTCGEYEAYNRATSASEWSEQFFNPPGEPAPEEAWIDIGQRRVSKGVRVRLQPRRGADSLDLFLAGRTARVERIHHDVENRTYVAVVVEDDPASDLHASSGRFLYFYPDELEPLED